MIEQPWSWLTTLPRIEDKTYWIKGRGAVECVFGGGTWLHAVIINV